MDGGSEEQREWKSCQSDRTEKKRDKEFSTDGCVCMCISTEQRILKKASFSNYTCQGNEMHNNLKDKV